ncbi:FxSxx-COOH system tetratricopeptide repeat protein [Streptomyces scabiei]|uniref:FxSxx-COOH system tetratricopeptide repeat protein n=1 Tax=Streptomyces scabiei TaxID=1930 RepID=UPI0029B7D24B|nr:FxSxx-COOH system tetratricopeptide repeat protein [Streptomyces scabiei]MDX3517392.1 FxSxx-COOH system tetratricopeptide repeat protein [Streptomyces scabiei]
MTAQGPDTGRIVTFYSYKGGTGRTMALVNVGWIMASNGLRVLLVDWDLEAPGLHRYLRPFLVDPELRDTDGLINMVQAYVGRVMGAGETATRSSSASGSGPTPMTEAELRDCARTGPYVTGLDPGLPAGARLDFLPAGRQSVSYSAAVTSFNWHAFYERMGGGFFLQVLREELKAAYDYVLIDSRTGVSDISGICTVLMPDVLVDGFALNLQSISGGVDVATSVADSAQRPIRILPVPMRVQYDQRERLDAGRESSRERFAPFLSWLGPGDRERYWNDVEIPYKSFYAYEEIPATVGDGSFREGSLLNAFERLTGWITEGRVTSFPPLPAEVRQRYEAAYLYGSWTPPSRLRVSYAPPDRMWAEWALSHLESVGYQVSLHRVGAHGGSTQAEAEADRRGRLVVLLSPDHPDWSWADGTRIGPRLAGSYGGPTPVALRVRGAAGAPQPGADASFVTDLTHCPAAEAARRLLTAVGSPPGTPDGARTALPVAAPFPDAVPAEWSLPARNTSFTGRDGLLEELRDHFTAGPSVPPLVLCGVGGMGKTQLAVEYAHRFKAAYDVIWWISAEQRGLIRPALADLAPRLGLDAGDDADRTAESVLRALSRGAPYDRWLLIYDNAERPEEMAEFVPDGPPGGHVLLTSRDRTRVGGGGLVDVEVFRRRESTELLHRLNPGLTEQEADQVAGELADLPLAVGQAAVWLSESSMPVSTYLALLKDRLTTVLSDTRLPARDYPRSAAATWCLAAEDLRRAHPGAADLLEICCFLGPEPIPMSLLYGDSVARALAPGQGEQADAFTVARAVRAVNRFGLARSDPAGQTVTVHRLVQAVIRDQVDDRRAVRVRGVVHSAIVRASPEDPDVPADWGRYAELIPHLRPSDAARSDDPEVRRWVSDATRYLWKRSLHGAARELAEHTLAVWEENGIGNPDDPQTLLLRTQLGNTLRAQGELTEAYGIDRDTFERFRATRGLEYEHTLAAAGNVGADLRSLGRYEEARTLERTTLETARRVLGEEHQRTLMSTNNLAVSEHVAGDRRAAVELHRHAYTLQSRLRGPDSLYTLLFASNYARDLRDTGRLQESLSLLETTVRRFEQTLGENHSGTLRARKNLAVALRRAGAYDRALEIDTDVHARYVDAHGPSHPDTLSAVSSLAADLAALGRLDRAEQLAEQAVDGWEEYLGTEHPATLVCVTNLSVYRRLLGVGDEALALSDRALRGLAGTVGETHPYTLSCMINHANHLVTAGRRREAGEMEQEARRRCLDVLGPGHHDTFTITANLALTLRAAGRSEEADRLREEAERHARSTLGETHPMTRAILSGERLDSDVEPPTT